MKLQLPPSKSKLTINFECRTLLIEFIGQISLLSSLSASQNEVSEKDRTISNETVGLNSTVILINP